MIDIDTVAQYICWYIAIQVGCRCMNPVSLKKVYLPGINEQFKLDPSEITSDRQLNLMK